MAERLRASWLLARTAFLVDPWRATGAFVVNPLAGVGFAVAAYWAKMVADAAVDGDASAALGASVGLAVTVLFIFGFALVGMRLMVGLWEKAGFALEENLSRVAANIPGLEHVERPEYHDRLDLIREEHRNLGMALNALVQAASVLLRFGATVGLLATLHPLLALLPIAGLPTLAAATAGERIIRRAEDAQAEDRRRARHLVEISTDASPAKELKAFGLEGEILERHDESAFAAYRIMLRARIRAAVLRAGGWLVFGIAFVAAIAFVASRAARGEATPGDVLLALTLAGQVNQNVSGLVMTISWLARMLRVVTRYVWILDYARGLPRGGDRPAPERLSDGIRFEGISFRYPGTEQDVLRDVNLHIPAGATVALVGENGAGKTTLVKLLCGFYRPTAGRILVDGLDLADIDLEEWRRRTSAGFQDFARFEFLARETVGVGDLPRLDDGEAVRVALERAGATEVAAQMPSGLGTLLGKVWGGAELSVGQWQQLALGRAMMRERPLLLVLDEPTASLDAQTEHALFERYARTAAEREAAGAVTILVSHRFSTVRMADLIVVVEGGRVVGAGAHAELMRRGGLYADLYSIQARAYR